METLTLTKNDRVAVVTMNRPKALNALNNQVFEELDSCMRDLREDAETAAVIITGSGEKAFVAGADIKEMEGMDVQSAKRLSARGQAVFRDIETFPKPVIAAVNGFALGGGCELALACHVRVASTNARLGLPEVSLGLIPGYGGTQRLLRLVGKGHALEITLSGQMINADRAFDIGLVNHVVEAEELMNVCAELAGKMIANGPIALRLAIEAITFGHDMPEEDGERLENNLFALAASTADAQEGITAFIEKRKAKFEGR